MLIIVSFMDGRVASFELGDALDPSRDPEAHLRWVLADYDDRRDAQWKVPPPEGELILARLLSCADDEPEVLLPLIRALGFYAMPDYGPYVVGARRDHIDPRVRFAVVKALGSMAAHDGLPYLWPLLDAPTPTLRRAAVEAVGKMSRLDALPPLEQRAAEDPSLLPIVERARRRAEAVAREDIDALVDITIGTEDYEDLGVLMPFIFQSVAIVLADPRRREIERMRAARLLGLARARKAGKIVLDVLAAPETSAPFQVHLVTALGRMRYRRAVPQIVARLDPEEPALQDAAITALGDIGDRRAFEPLLARYNDRAGAVRERARLALRRVAPPLAVEDYTAWLEGATGLEPYASYSFADDLRPIAGVGLDATRAKINHPRSEVRREALLLIALFGEPRDEVLLTSAAQSDQDAQNRALAARARRELVARHTPWMAP